nr:hypothetical protein [Amylibacter sp.]
MLTHLKHATARAARKAGILCGGVICILVGAGFLTVSLWIYLSTAYDTAFAASVLGCGYMGIGLLVIGLIGFGGKDPEPPRAHAASAPPADGPAMMQAFLYGMQAGSDTQKPKPQ